jgi:hypothetical protein
MREAKFHTIQNTRKNYNCAELCGAKFTDISEQCTAYIFRTEDGLLVVTSAPPYLPELALNGSSDGHKTQIGLCDTTQQQTQTTQTENLLSRYLFLLPGVFGYVGADDVTRHVLVITLVILR